MFNEEAFTDAIQRFDFSGGQRQPGGQAWARSLINAYLAEAEKRRAIHTPEPCGEGWQPIEKADPLSGERVLVGNSGRNGVTPFTCEARYHQGEGWYRIGSYPSEGFSQPLPVTHYRPMISPPPADEATND